MDWLPLAISTPSLQHTLRCVVQLVMLTATLTLAAAGRSEVVCPMCTNYPHTLFRAAAAAAIAGGGGGNKQHAIDDQALPLPTHAMLRLPTPLPRLLPLLMLDILLGYNPAAICTASPAIAAATASLHPLPCYSSLPSLRALPPGGCSAQVLLIAQLGAAAGVLPPLSLVFLLGFLDTPSPSSSLHSFPAALPS
jgi:hypothetical protein